MFVNYHSERLIDPRARRLLEAGFEVVVADNSCTYEGAGRIVRLPVNAGFGAGCNAAIATLGGTTSQVVLHNPDVDAAPELLHELCARLRSQERPGLLAPGLRVNGQVRPDGFRMPTVPREAALSILETRAAAISRPRRPEAPPGSGDAPRDRFGSAALLAGDLGAIRGVGGFDERYFLYVEDLDLWWRVRKSGLGVGFAADLLVDHHSASGSPMATLDRAVLRWIGVELFAASHRSRSWPAFRAAHLPAALLARARGADLAKLVAGWWARGWSPLRVAANVKALLQRR